MRTSLPLALLAALPFVVRPAAAQCGSTFEVFSQSIAPGFEPYVAEFGLFDPDGDGPEPDRLAAVGSFFDLNGQFFGDLVTHDAATDTFAQLANSTGNSLVGIATGSDGQLAVLYQDGFSDFGVLVWDGQALTTLVTVAGGSFGRGGIRDILYLPDGDLLVGGAFSSIAGIQASRVARWNGATWTAMGNGLAGDLSTFRLDPSGALIAGTEGASAEGVARFDGTVWSAHLTGSAGTARTVNDFSFLADGRVAATGIFEFTGPVSSSSFAVWDGADWTLPGGVAVPLTFPTFPSALAVEELPGGDLVVGGSFDSVGAVTARGLARFDGNSWSELLSPFLADSDVRDLRLGPGGDLWACGTFFDLFGVDSVAGGLARVVADCKAQARAFGSSGSGSFGPVELSTNDLPWVDANFDARVEGLGVGALSLGLLGVESTSVPLATLTPDASADSTLLLQPLAGFTTALPSAAGTADWAITIPPNGNLVGVSVFLQALSVELLPGGAALFSTSNGLALVPGDF